MRWGLLLGCALAMTGIARRDAGAAPDPYWQIRGLLAALEDADLDIRVTAFEKLGQLEDDALLREADRLLVQDLRLDSLRVSEEHYVAAAVTLSRLPRTSAAHQAQIVDWVRSKNVGWARAGTLPEAVDALAATGSPARGHAAKLVPLLARSPSDGEPSPNRTRDALLAMGPLPRDVIYRIMDLAYGDTARRQEFVLDACWLSGGDTQVRGALRWLLHGRRSDVMAVSQAREVFTLVLAAWRDAEPAPAVRGEIADVVQELVPRTDWHIADIALLETAQATLRSLASTASKASGITGELTRLRALRLARRILQGVGAQLLLWIVLIWAYPHSSRVQAFVLFSPWVRRIVGLGYVNVLLMHVPLLQRRLLRPFRSALIAEAERDGESNDVDPTSTYYFDRSLVEVHDERGQATRAPLHSTIPEMSGRMLLLGESGLGKSMFAQRLVLAAKRPTVYLPAERCGAGVVAAIEQCLAGLIQDRTFIEALVHQGGIDVCIDGLNEVSSDTRSEINQFLDRFKRVRSLLVSQPLIDWTPSARTVTYRLCPLSREQIIEFLVGWAAAKSGNEAAAALKTRSQQYVERLLRDDQPPEMLQASQEILSNPMDLSVVSQLLVAGHEPDLLRLQAQQYDLMADDYRRANRTAFPVLRFADRVYEMRRTDDSKLPADEFRAEIAALDGRKLVIRRVYKDSQGREIVEWRFRHDKILEYLVLQAFLAKPERQTEHIDDARFRGVYFLMAMQLPLDLARSLRETLILRAAQTSDHNVSDRFVQLLATRTRLRRAGPAWAAEWVLAGETELDAELTALRQTHEAAGRSVDDAAARLEAIRERRLLLHATTDEDLRRGALAALRAAGAIPEERGAIVHCAIHGHDLALGFAARSRTLTASDLEIVLNDLGAWSAQVHAAITNQCGDAAPAARPPAHDDEASHRAEQAGVRLVTSLELFEAVERGLRAGDADQAIARVLAPPPPPARREAG